MSDDGTPLIDADIVARFATGTLIDVLCLERHADRPDSCRNRAVALHNRGQIDLLRLTTTPGFVALGGTDFFSVQRVFCDAIPYLEAPLIAMMAAVERLAEKGGRDGAAGFPYNAFKLWLDKDLARARAVVAAADAGEEVNQQFIAIALEALGDNVLAERVVGQYNDGRRLAGLSALGRIKPAGEAEAKATLDILLPLCGGSFDEDTRFAAISAAFGVLKNFGALHGTVVPQLIAAVTHTPTEFTRFALVQALWLHDKVFDARSVKATLDVARGGDFSKKGLVDTLDGALQQLFGTMHRDLALDFLTDVLAIEDGLLALNKLDSVKHRLAASSRDQLFALAVRWFLTGNKQLCEAMAEILSQSDRAAPFDASMKGLGLTGSQQVVVCHKALAYLLLRPVISASMVVAALRAGDSGVRDNLIQLLVYPILINFQGEARDYLRSIKKDDAACGAVRKALKQGDAYVIGAQIKTPIKELWPSDYRRNLAAMKLHDQGREISKMAERQSIFFNLAHRSTLLYGRKALTYVGGPDKPPVMMELKPMSFGLDMPRLNTIDPVGLDYMMRVFRVSKPK